jgi:amino acid transporter
MFPFYLIMGFLFVIYHFWWQILLGMFAIAAVMVAIEMALDGLCKLIYSMKRQYHKRKYEENLARWRQR